MKFTLVLQTTGQRKQVEVENKSQLQDVASVEFKLDKLVTI